MKTSFVVRYLAWLTIITILGVLFIDSLGGPFDLSEYGIPQPGAEAQEQNFIIGIILLATGLMILIETVFQRKIGQLSNPRSLNFFLGIPSGIVAIILGISWIVGFTTLIDIFGTFLDGVYMSGLIILIYEGLISLSEEGAS